MYVGLRFSPTPLIRVEFLVLSMIICIVIYSEQVVMDMVNWQVTATTIYCDALDEEVTIMVYKDGTARCVGYKKYHQPSRETAKLMKAKGKRLKREPKCNGPECPQVSQYRDRLFAEETKRGSSK